MITSASAGSIPAIGSTLASISGQTFRVEFFASETPDSTGDGEGRVLLGVEDVATDRAGNATFTFFPGQPIAAGSVVSATAGSDSADASGTINDGRGRCRLLGVRLNSRPTAPVTVAFCSKNPSRGAVVTSRLTFTPDAWAVPQAVVVVGSSGDGRQPKAGRKGRRRPDGSWTRADRAGRMAGWTASGREQGSWGDPCRGLALRAALVPDIGAWRSSCPGPCNPVGIHRR